MSEMGSQISQGFLFLGSQIKTLVVPYLLSSLSPKSGPLRPNPKPKAVPNPNPSPIGTGGDTKITWATHPTTHNF